MDKGKAKKGFLTITLDKSVNLVQKTRFGAIISVHACNYAVKKQEKKTKGKN